MEISIESLKAPCICGKTHPLFVNDLWIEPGALHRLPKLLRDYHSPAVICDENTYMAAGKAACAILPDCVCIKLPAQNLHANERGVALAKEQLKNAPDILVAAGSGTIHDITRFIAHEKGIPFISVPTAASVDGFVSTVAAMTWEGFKKTFPAVSPLYVLADTDIFSKAPQRLTASGVADLLGKYTALADWKASHLLTGEYICPHICELEDKALQTLRGCLPELAKGSKGAYETLMYGLLLSGLAMQMAGNSRPASGAEHHLSHLWEMEAINSYVDAYHGQKVGVGLLLAAEVYHRAAKKLHAGAGTVPYHGIETALLKEKLPERLLHSILKENEPDPMANLTEKTLVAKEMELADILDAIPTAAELSAILEQVGGVRTMADIGLNASLRTDSLRLSPYVRNRLTAMRILKRFDFYEEVIS